MVISTKQEHRTWPSGCPSIICSHQLKVRGLACRLYLPDERPLTKRLSQDKATE
jgi:hypothetical protein